ncbi:adenine deaminase [Treponema sp. JC4]|uniref:adenine deaminase n=1 Tax=Treponema sp. JC4 TaxID=1124982 RepID=UPI00025AFBBE|nr:adenine deaminase [Treponema sp. JC4]EID85398.1 adenine deaminase [Treponema sp. JC4]
MEKKELKKLIETATGKVSADLCIKNAKIVDVFTRNVFEGDIFISDGYIAGFGGYNYPPVKEVFDAKGSYIAPGLIDAHVHIESSHLCPAEFSRLVVPHGTTTVVADPHEICNVCGLDGLDYMLKASEKLALKVFIQFPSCVPATPFENSGAELGAEEIASRIENPRILALGEFMNYVGVCNADEEILDKIMAARKAGKYFDGHSPSLFGNWLDAYIAAGAINDHECSTPEEALERLKRGMYVMLREGTACNDLEKLLPIVNDNNSHLCMFCTDDRQPSSIVNDGHIDNNVRLAIKNGLNPITALTMATLNAANCYGLKDRGAVAPGRLADLILFDDLNDFKVRKVWASGKLVSDEGKYLASDLVVKPEKVSGKMNVKNFSRERLALKLESDRARAIKIIPHSIVTEDAEVKVSRDKDGFWQRNSDDVVKIAVVERHKGTGNVGLGLIQGFGLKGGAMAMTIAHDSHNIIVIGDSDEDMEAAVNCLIEIGGGMAIAKEGKILSSFQHEIAGLMCTKPAYEVAEKIKEMKEIVKNQLHISSEIAPFMTLCFMALPVIPALKITDMGLFDVTQFKHVSVEI